ncbi:MAG: glyoxalase [Bacteroidota bacterium]
MKITKLVLNTNRLASEKKFYSAASGFELIASTPDHFTVKIGWSELTFRKSRRPHTYHYCFLLPSNKLQQGIEWLAKRVELIEVERGKYTQFFDSWNAESVYFLDKSGNVAEFIVRYDLKNETTAPFGIDQILGINEIGLPTTDIETTNKVLEQEIKTTFWKGNFQRFGTNGTQEGLFLLPNYEVKETWFPTELRIAPEPLEVTVKNGRAKYSLTYVAEHLNISAITA